MGLAEYAEARGSYGESSVRFDILLLEVVEGGGGQLRQGVLEDRSLAWEALLKPEAVVLPRAATVVVQPVHCSYILRQNSVQTEAVCGLNLSSLDAWRVTTFREVDLRPTGVPFDAFGEPVKSLEISLGPGVPSNGASDILGSAQKGTRVSVPITQSGLVTSVAYWFELDLGYGHCINTGPRGGVTTRGKKQPEPTTPPHWRQALAVLPDGGVQVAAGQVLAMTVACVGSSICISEARAG